MGDADSGVDAGTARKAEVKEEKRGGFTKAEPKPGTQYQAPSPEKGKAIDPSSAPDKFETGHNHAMFQYETYKRRHDAPDSGE